MGSGHHFAEQPPNFDTANARPAPPVLFFPQFFSRDENMGPSRSFHLPPRHLLPIFHWRITGSSYIYGEHTRNLSNPLLCWLSKKSRRLFAFPPCSQKTLRNLTFSSSSRYASATSFRPSRLGCCLPRGAQGPLRWLSPCTDSQTAFSVAFMALRTSVVISLKA